MTVNNAMGSRPITHPVAYKRKLIEIALPLEAINRESAREKNIRHGHPATLHLWWARRPLAACRSILFGQLVDDPSEHPERFPTTADQDRERNRLFRIIEQLVEWESSNDPKVLSQANQAIRDSVGDSLPTILDPFAGGGAIPLEAQRLGLPVIASDLNPVAVLINTALLALPVRYALRQPIHQTDRGLDIGHGLTGTFGLASDIRHYGQRLTEKAKVALADLYPDVATGSRQSANVIAWLWARTVICPNPACRGTMPLARSFQLGRKPGKEAWVEAFPQPEERKVRFAIGHGADGPQEGTVNRNGAQCLICKSQVPLAYVRTEGKAGRMGAQMMAVVAEGARQRIYLAPDDTQVRASLVSRPTDIHETDLPEQALGFRVQGYGMTRHSDLFSNRQLVATSTLVRLVREIHDEIVSESQSHDYGCAVSTYLAFAVSRVIGSSSTICTWNSNPKNENLRDTFARPTLSMSWDYAEANIFGPSSGNLSDSIDWVAKAVDRLPTVGTPVVRQADAASQNAIPNGVVVCTDPPYYDNVGYADLSDYFYVWLREMLANCYPELFSTVLTPKVAELIADPFRAGSPEAAKTFFESGFVKAFASIRAHARNDLPLTLFYAFKQAEQDGGGTAFSTGWETMLEGLIRAGFLITGTWPIRTERGGRMREVDSNALASSIVLVCRPRPDAAPIADRRQFISDLKLELPPALRNLQQGGIAPVDLAQAAVGPGMAVFSRYAKVVEADGSAMTIRTALGMINQVLDETLAEQEGDFDVSTRWAIAWFEQFGMGAGDFGTAETLSRAKNAAVNRLVDAGIVRARAGKVQLVDREGLRPDWDPIMDDRLTAWQVTQYLIRALETGGESAAAELVVRIGGLAETARELAYRLYNVCERRKWAKDAASYNTLVVAWPAIRQLADSNVGQAVQLELGS